MLKLDSHEATRRSKRPRLPPRSSEELYRLPGNALVTPSEASLVTGCARNIETLRSDRELKEAWGLDERQWAQLAVNDELLDAIKAERERRIRSGDAARGTAQRHFAKAAFVLNEILHDRGISP